MRRTLTRSACLLLPVLLLSGCQTIREIANLRQVDFAIDRVTDARMAGVDLSGVRSYQDLSANDLLRLGRAIGAQELPLDFRLHLRAENPETNSVQARLVSMDWTLFLDERETVSGVFNDDVVLPPGSPRNIPITVELDLVRFFGDNLQDLVEIALSVAGQGGEPKEIMLQAQPSVDTPIGPIRYPRPITILRREVGPASP